MKRLIYLLVLFFYVALNLQANTPGAGPAAGYFGKLDIPRNVRATKGTHEDKVVLTWNPVSGATHYKIFRGGTQVSADAKAITDWQSSAMGATFEDYAAEPGKVHYYFVKAAMSASGSEESGFSVYETGYIKTAPSSISLAGNLGFGSLIVGQPATKTLEIQNNGGTDINISGITYPEGFKGNWQSGTLGAGQKRQVTVTFTPTTVKTYSGEVTVHSNATSGTNKIAVSGVGTFIPVGLQASNGTFTDKVSIKWANSAHLSHYRVFRSESNNASSATAISGWLANDQFDDITALPGKIYYYFVKGATNASGANGTIFSEGAPGSLQEAIRNARLSGDLNFGEVKVNTTAKRDMVITNDGNTKLTVSNIVLPDGFEANWKQGDIAANGKQTIEVTFRPIKEGECKGEVKVQCNANGGDPSRPVQGIGVKVPNENGPGTPFAEFILVDAETNKDIKLMEDGEKLYLDRLPTDQLNIRADVNGSQVESVVFFLNGEEFRVENVAPYAMAGDTDSDYFAWVPEEGQYVLTIYVYSERNAKGLLGSQTITFQVANKEQIAFTLINAETDQDIQKLEDGDLIDLKAFSTAAFNIRADVDGDLPGSVVFFVNGTQFRTENVAPFAMAGDFDGDYFDWVPEEGDYEVTAYAYEGRNGSGAILAKETIHISFVHLEGIIGFSLMDADTDRKIQTIKNGEVIDLHSLPTDRLNIRADVATEDMGSVVFYLNGEEFRIESVAPYAMAGDLDGDYFDWVPEVGTYKLVAKAFAGRNGGGGVLYEREVSFEITKSPVTALRFRNIKEGDVFMTRENIYISVLVPDGYVDKAAVVFKVNGITLDKAIEAPYETKWFPLTARSYTVEAVLLDKDGNEVESASVAIRVEAPKNAVPVVELRDPKNGQEFAYGKTITLEAYAQSKGAISKVALYSNGKLMAEGKYNTLSYEWKFPEPGEYEIMAKATDSHGETGSSEAIKVTVLPAPGEETAGKEEEKEKETDHSAEKPVITYGPNPVKDLLTITFSHPEVGGMVKIQLVNSQGHVVLYIEGKKKAETVGFPANMANMPNGLYIVNITYEGHKESMRVLKE